jgi:hypothetical protein
VALGYRYLARYQVAPVSVSYQPVLVLLNLLAWPQTQPTFVEPGPLAL